MIPYPTTKKDELIAKLYNKSLRLSYSTLKQFTSPINLINYKLKPFSPNASMIFGSLCDCLLLTEEDFDNQFVIVDVMPTTDVQEAFANELIEIGQETPLTEDIIETVFSNHYKRGKAMDTFLKLQAHIEAAISGKQGISSEVYQEAKEVKENLMSNPDIQSLFDQMISAQHKMEWQHNGWNFIGYLDMLLPDHIIDLKFSKDANPDKFERDIQNFDYYLQAAMYCFAAKQLGISENPRYSFIVYDKSMNYSVITLDYSYLAYGERKYKYLIQELERCVDEGAFDQSYGFFKRLHTAYKPKWLKGFKLEEDPD